MAKTTTQKKRRVELKKKRVREAQERILWSRQHGHDTYSGAQCDSEHSDIDVKVSHGEGRQKVSSRGKGRPQEKGNCASCGCSTHKRSSHKHCPFHKSRGKKGANTASRTNVLKDMSESDGDVSSDGIPDTEGNEIESDIDLCVCGAVGRQHRRSCPLSYRNRRTGRTLFPAASSAGQPADSATSDNVTPPPSKAEMKVGEGFQRSEWCKKHGRDAYGGSIGDDEDESHHGKVKKSRRGKAKLKKASRVRACVGLVGLQLTSVGHTEIVLSTLNMPLQKQVPSLIWL